MLVCLFKVICKLHTCNWILLEELSRLYSCHIYSIKRRPQICKCHSRLNATDGSKTTNERRPRINSPRHQKSAVFTRG